MKNLYKMIFFITMTFGTLFAISSLSWFISWIGLEINLLSLIPLMKEFKNKLTSESTIKYFIVQAYSSAFLLISILIYNISNNYSEEFNIFASLLIGSALLLKMGAAPFHWWFPEVISGFKWEIIFIIMTWQKIAPMILLSFSMKAPIFLSIVIILSSMISGLQGINQMCLRKILAYSSINHVSWMISAMLNSASTWFYYFIIYCIMNFNIILIFNKYQVFYINQLSKLFSFNKKTKFFFMLNFLSLGGLPPFLGFFPKWMTINHMIKNNYYILCILLIIFTLISLYFYIRITFSTFTMNSEESLIKIFNKISYFHFFTNLFSLIGLIICTITVNFL